MVGIPTNRAPTHPGEMLLEEFLKPMNLTQTELATRIGVPLNRVNEIVKGDYSHTTSCNDDHMRAELGATPLPTRERTRHGACYRTTAFRHNGRRGNWCSTTPARLT